jgi:hypothetical protein
MSGCACAQVLGAADGDDDAIHGDDGESGVSGGVRRPWWRVVVGEVPGRRRHGGAGVRTCEDAA